MSIGRLIKPSTTLLWKVARPTKREAQRVRVSKRNDGGRDSLQLTCATEATRRANLEPGGSRAVAGAGVSDRRIGK